MDSRTREKIVAELKKSAEYITAAELLQKAGMHTPAVMVTFYSTLHSTTAAFLTHSAKPDELGSRALFSHALDNAGSRLDPFLERLKDGKKDMDAVQGVSYTQRDASLRIAHAKELLADVKSFVKKILG